MRRFACVGAVAAFHLFHGDVAWGCGATPEVVNQFLPADDATNVPMDAALFVAANFSVPTAIVLRRVNDGAPSSPAPSGEAQPSEARPSDARPGPAPAFDAGAASSDAGVVAEVNEVEVAFSCHDAPGHHLCVGKPASPLAANTTYEWSVITSDNNSSATVRVTPSQRFTTGENPADVTEQGLQADVVAHVYGAPYQGCPTGGVPPDVRKVTVQVTGAQLKGPLVVKAPLGVWGWGFVLTPEASAQSLVLDEPPECFAIEAFDVTGKHGETDEICPEALLPVVGSPEVTEPAPPSASTSVTSTSTATAETTTLEATTAAEEPAETSEPSSEEPSVGVRHNGVDEATDSGACALSPKGRDATSPFAVFGLLALGAMTAWRRRANA